MSGSVLVQDGGTALYMASMEGHCGVVRMLLEAKADVHVKTNVSHAACMVVFVYSADSMVECVYCHLCVSLIPRPIFLEGGKSLVSIAWVLVRMVIVH